MLNPIQHTEMHNSLQDPGQASLKTDSSGQFLIVMNGYGQIRTVTGSLLCAVIRKATRNLFECHQPRVVMCR